MSDPALHVSCADSPLLPGMEQIGSRERRRTSAAAASDTGGTPAAVQSIKLHEGGTRADYSVAVAMNQNTVDMLSQGAFNLYAFKAVQGAGNGAPTVWFKSTNFSLETDVQWQVAYQAYTSKTQIVPNGQIKASAPYDIDLKQTLNVTSTTGTGAVDTSTGTTGAISIFNQTTTQFTCGISQQQADGTFGPMCAFPLYGNNLDVIAPIEKVLLMFSTNPVNTGTVVYQAYSQGLMIDLTGATERKVSYDINNGWSWPGSASWGKVYPANSNLVPLLIQSSPTLEQARLTALAGAEPLFFAARPAEIAGQDEG